MKLKKIFILSMLGFLLTGCTFDITQYKPINPENNNSSNNQDSPIVNSNVINPSNYSGTINYAPNDQEELSGEEIYKKGVISSVYIIATVGNSYYLGSGVFFSEDTTSDGYAYIFTNAHVVSGASNIEIVYSNYKHDTAQIIGYHVLEDVAVLSVKKNNNYTIPTLKTSDKLEIASKVVTIGSPISTDYSFTSTSGIISKIDSPLSSTFDENYGLLLLQTDATLNSGNSGGPLFDKYGNLIGLNTMKVVYDESYNSVDNFNFSIPIERALFLAKSFFENKPYDRGLLGITIVDIVDMTLPQRSARKITLDYGLYVEEVSQTGASNNHILSGDIITKINDIKFTTKIQFQKELYNYSKNDTITLTLLRDGETKVVTITLK